MRIRLTIDFDVDEGGFDGGPTQREQLAQHVLLRIAEGLRIQRATVYAATTSVLVGATRPASAPSRTQARLLRWHLTQESDGTKITSANWASARKICLEKGWLRDCTATPFYEVTDEGAAALRLYDKGI